MFSCRSLRNSLFGISHGISHDDGINLSRCSQREDEKHVFFCHALRRRRLSSDLKSIKAKNTRLAICSILFMEASERATNLTLLSINNFSLFRHIWISGCQLSVTQTRKRFGIRPIAIYS